MFIVKSLKLLLQLEKTNSTILICKNIGYISRIIIIMNISRTYFNWFYFFFS